MLAKKGNDVVERLSAGNPIAVRDRDAVVPEDEYPRHGLQQVAALERGGQPGHSGTWSRRRGHDVGSLIARRKPLVSHAFAP